ncbi:unnamed protein product [Nezara viridula]|uniref:Uncharacterized protein n=1 Tax=Nezara viridula TaxID=85310 RepID=A0A9P0MLS7_NEZVI|nr:unnamed protein product [Nezara viridula]
MARKTTLEEQMRSSWLPFVRGHTATCYTLLLYLSLSGPRVNVLKARVLGSRSSARRKSLRLAADSKQLPAANGLQASGSICKRHSKTQANLSIRHSQEFTAMPRLFPGVDQLQKWNVSREAKKLLETDKLLFPLLVSMTAA